MCFNHEKNLGLQRLSLPHKRSNTRRRDESLDYISPPQIVVQELESLENVFQEYLIISGRVLGNFEKFKINEQVKIQKGSDVRFSFKQKLHLGEENEITLEVSGCRSDAPENCKKTYRITRHPSPEEIREFRATTVICPLAKDGGDGELTESLLWDMRIAMIENRRFQISAANDEIQYIADREFQLKEEGWIDAGSAARFAKKLDADYCVACTVRPTKDDIEIYGRLIDTKTQKTLASCDVYEHAKDAEDFKNAYQRFIEELGQNFPVIKNEIDPLPRKKGLGKIIKNLVFFSKGDDIILQMGKNAHIQEGMRFVAYYRDEPLVDAETGAVLVQGKVNRVGELFVNLVRHRFAHLQPITRIDIEKAKYVISK